MRNGKGYVAARFLYFASFFDFEKFSFFANFCEICPEWQWRRRAVRIRRGYYIPLEVTIYFWNLLEGYYIHLEVSGSAFVFECELVFRLFIWKFEFVIVRGVMKFSRERAEA